MFTSVVVYAQFRKYNEPGFNWRGGLLTCRPVSWVERPPVCVMYNPKAISKLDYYDSYNLLTIMRQNITIAITCVSFCQGALMWYVTRKSWVGLRTINVYSETTSTRGLVVVKPEKLLSK